MTQEETGLIPTDGGPPVSLLSGSPGDRITEAKEIAKALAPIVDQKNLHITISGRKYVLYEGWTTLGALVGVFPQTVWSRRVEGGGVAGWEARVEAHTLAGQVVGAAEAQCLRDEKNWKTRDDYALRSMAQTRAAAKALRMPLGFIMALAGYEATPAEEMPRETAQGRRLAPVSAQQKPGLWECGECNTKNDQRNDKCYKCGTDRE